MNTRMGARQETRARHTIGRHLKVPFLALAISFIFVEQGSCQDIPDASKPTAAEKELKRVVKLRDAFIAPGDSRLIDSISTKDPDEFVRLLISYREHAFAVAGLHQRKPSERSEEVRKYVDNEVRYFAYLYDVYYGVDRAQEDEQMEEFTKAASHRNDTAYMNSLIRKMTAAAMKRKFLPLAKRNFWDSIEWKGFDMNDSVSYRISEDFRELYDFRLETRLRSRAMKNFSLLKADRLALKRDLVAEEVKDNYIRERLFYEITDNLLNKKKDIERYYQEYLDLAKNEKYRERIVSKYALLKSLVPGRPFPDFPFEDVEGSAVSLSSYKGSYLYLDLWASWCVPCKAEIPWLDSVQHGYAGKNIRFVSISIDEKSTVRAWKSMVRNSRVARTQLLAAGGFGGEFAKAINLVSIPRFILIDPQFNVVSWDELRPSDPALAAVLDKL